MAADDTAATALLFGRDEVEEVDDWADRVAHLGRTSILRLEPPRRRRAELGGWVGGPRRVPHLGRTSILWIALPRLDEEQARHVAKALELAPASTERLADHKGKPFSGDFRRDVHINHDAPAANGTKSELERVACLVSKRWVLT